MERSGTLWHAVECMTAATAMSQQRATKVRLHVHQPLKQRLMA